MATVRGKPLDLIAEDPKYDAANVIIWGTYLTLSLQDLLRALLWGRCSQKMMHQLDFVMETRWPL